MDNLVEQGKFKLESAVRKRWHIHLPVYSCFGQSSPVQSSP